MITDNEQLSALCKSTTVAIQEGLQWIKNGNLEQDTTALIKNLRKTALATSKLETAATRKMCVGVFGVSQAGKSYLISALARKANERLTANFDGKLVDFIEEINPEGGKESTGLVTRFTVDSSQVLPPGHPIEVRLLTETDLVKILTNSYVYDIAHDDEDEAYHSAEVILNEIEQIAKLADSSLSANVNQEDILDLEDYCNQKLIANPRIKVLKNIGFWDKAMILAPQLNDNDRARLFSLIWNDIEVFTYLYKRLTATLRKLGFQKTAFCSTNGLLTADDQRLNQGSIIDVGTLSGLDSEEGDMVSVVSGQQQTPIDVNRSELTALIAELKIVMQQKPFNFFDHTDLLDFPGARSRETQRNNPEKLKQPELREQLFLRGKVAYLFERYCAEQELTSMLLCMGPENMEVVSLPDLAFEWIKVSHGETPEERSKQANALFLVLTKFDKSFEQAAGKGTGSNRWTTRLETSLLKAFGNRYDWPRKWDEQGAFNNCYCVRNPNFRQDSLLEYETPTSYKETQIRPDKQEYLQTLQESFLTNAEVKTHFQDASTSWDAVMSLNDGGVQHIAAKLEPLCEPQLKRDQVYAGLQRLAANTNAELQQFYFSGDLDAERKKKRNMAKRIAQSIALCMKKQLFGEFLATLQMDENDLYELYLSIQQKAPEQDTDESGDDEQQQNMAAIYPEDDILDDLDGIFGHDDANDSTENESETIHNAIESQDVASQFVSAIEEKWSEQIKGLSDDKKLMRFFGFQGVDIVELGQEIQMAARRNKLFELMAENVRKASQFKDVNKEAAIWKKVVPATYLLNEFNNWLGYGGSFKREGSVINHDNGQQSHIFKPKQAPGVNAYPVLEVDSLPYHKTFYLDWLKAFSQLVDDNVAFQAGTEVDLEKNGRLGLILEQIKRVDQPVQ